METFDVREKTTPRYRARLLDEADDPIPGTGLSTLTLTFYDSATGEIVNNRNSQNALNANGVTVDEDGWLTWEMSLADTTLVDTTKPYARHIALWVWTWDEASKRGNHNVAFRVKNVERIS